jgi:hypothetical protein
VEFIYVKMKIYIFDACRYFFPLKTFLFIIFFYWLCFTTVESSLYFGANANSVWDDEKMSPSTTKLGLAFFFFFVA